MVFPAQAMRDHLATYYLRDTVVVERITTGGVWEQVGSFPANVQYEYERVSQSPDDPNEARENERRGINVFLAHTATPSLEVGQRVTWNAEHWMVSAVHPPRTSATYARLTCRREQIATAPILLTFRRRLPNKQWGDFGPFQVQVTVDQREPLDQSWATIFDAATARGATVTGVMVGGSDLVDLRTGDWFSLRGFPGRITGVDASNPERVELSYRVEQRGV